MFINSTSQPLGSYRGEKEMTREHTHTHVHTYLLGVEVRHYSEDLSFSQGPLPSSTICPPVPHLGVVVTVSIEHLGEGGGGAGAGGWAGKHK